jgi:peptidoglycan/xylan/chitin deacetylase (PgdA/CDA1 family)
MFKKVIMWSVIILLPLAAGGMLVLRDMSVANSQTQAKSISKPSVKSTQAKATDISKSQQSSASSNEAVTPFPRGVASINFDDGFESAYQNGFSVLKKAGIKGTFYIISNRVGQPNYVTRDQVLEMQANGQEIGAHTRNHVHLTKVSASDLASEITGSKNDLINMGVKEVSTFAYPYGDFNLAVEYAVMDSGGFLGARDTRPGYSGENSDPFALSRIGVESTTTFDAVKASIDDAMQKKMWIILVFHRVDENGNPISVNHEIIQQIVDYLKFKQIPVITNAEGLKEMQAWRLTHESMHILQVQQSQPGTKSD